MIFDGEVLIFGDTCQGILLVGEPIKNPGISTNTVLYAAITTIIVVVSVFLAVFVAKRL